MTGLLEFKEKIKSIYSHNEVFILPVVKFLVAFVTFCIINGQMGYMTRLDNMVVVLIAALLCSFMPNVMIVLFGGLFSLLHMYALSVEVALVGLVVYLLLFLLFLRFGPKDSLVVIITPILCMLQIPYVMPVAMGLIGTPISAVTVCCGVVVYYLIFTVTENAAAISTMSEDDAIGKIRMIVDGLLENKAMLIVLVAFTVTVIVVYLIRRMSIDYSWTIAIVAGAMINLVVLLIGDLIYDTNLSVLGAVVGSVIAILVAKIVEFFRFCVDYSRTEKVQFEDDEYYYYVKAVPKMTVSAQTKTVKKINTNHRAAYSNGRAVTMERTGASRNYQGQRSHNGNREHLNGGKSMTISSNRATEVQEDDYEELF